MTADPVCRTTAISRNANSQLSGRGGSGVRHLGATMLIALLGASAALGQNSITNTSNGTLASVIALGSLTPGRTSAVTSGQAIFQLTGDNRNGYRLDASVSFLPGAAASVNGGNTIAASDIGVGITSIVAQPGVIQPRSDTILAGFNYNPATVTAIDGLTPYSGAASGKATLADLLTSKRILAGNRIGTGSSYLTVTMTFGLLPQYFSPCSFSAIVTMTISTGP